MRFIFCLILALTIALTVKAQPSIASSAQAQAEAGNYEEAIRLEVQNLKYIESQEGKQSFDYLFSLTSLGNYCSAAGYYQDALELTAEALSILKNNGGNEEIELILMNNLASINANLGNYQEAIRVGKDVVERRANSLGKKHPDFANALSNLAAYMMEAGEMDNALPPNIEALEIREEILGKEHPSYIVTLNNLAYIYSATGRYMEAIELGTQVLKAKEKIYGSDHPSYATSLDNLALYYSSVGNYREAIKLENEALEIFATTIGKNHPTYAGALFNLSNFYTSTGNFNRGIQLGNEGLEILINTLGTKHPHYARALEELSSSLDKAGRYDEAFIYARKSLDLTVGNHGKQHPLYASALSTLSSIYSNFGDYEEAIKLEKEVIEIYENLLGKDHVNYGVALGNLANLYHKIGNEPEAIRLQTESADIIGNAVGREHLTYAKALNNLSVYQGASKDYKSALETARLSLAICKNIFGARHPEYALTLHNIATFYHALGLLNEGIELETEVVSILGEYYGKSNIEYAKALATLASLHSLQYNIDQAITLDEEAMEILEKFIGNSHPDLMTLRINLCSDYFLNGRKEKLQEMSASITSDLSDYIRSNFLYLTTQERSLFWNTVKTWFELCLPEHSYRYPSEQLIEEAYNGILLSKGVLLNSELEFIKFLDETGSRELTHQFKEIKDLRASLNSQYSLQKDQRDEDIASLERKILTLESELMRKSKELGDYTQNMSATWKDIRENLGQKDAAIEFKRVYVSPDSMMYVAFILTREMTSPQMVKLFEEKDLRKDSRGIYTTLKGTEAVWQPIFPLITDKENVYFSPDGILHQIAIEYFPDNEDKRRMISDRFNLYRLSSTREITASPKSLRPGSGTSYIFGGIAYDSDIATMTNESRKYRHEEKRGVATDNGLAASLNLRSGLGYLHFTLLEAEKVGEILASENMDCRILTGRNASEESIRILSGKQPQILHIATHGFYFDEEEAIESANRGGRIPFIRDIDDNVGISSEDRALSRSGLFMAGANNVLAGQILPQGVDDGILTAGEIASLDLKGTDIIVLSACQTGMGDIGGDGVFGLQRGFKKAGAGALLMSLWNVDDAATEMLMTEFYNNYIQGSSKREALRAAQKKVREFNGEINGEIRNFSNPRFWAAFILLDGF